MADQNPQINQNVDNQNDTDELFWWSDDIFENSDLLQPINSEVDTAHQVIKSQNDLNNFSGEVQNNNTENQVSEYSDSKIYIQNDTQDEEINQLKNPNDVQGTSDDLFDNAKQENVETNTEFTNLYNENWNIEQQPQENSYSDNDDIFNETPANSDETFEEIPEIEDISGNTEEENPVMENEPAISSSSDSDETFEEIPEIEDISGNNQQENSMMNDNSFDWTMSDSNETFEEIPEIEDISGNNQEESSVMSNEPSIPSSSDSNETFEEIPEIEDISGNNQEESFETPDIEPVNQDSQDTENIDDVESTDNVQSTPTEDLDSEYDDINDDIAELQNREDEEVDDNDGSEYSNTDEENSNEEYQETDNFDDENLNHEDEWHPDIVEDIPEDTDIIDDNFDDDSDEEYDDEETEEEFASNWENDDEDEEFVPQDEQNENIEQETKEDDIESAVVQDYEKYDPNLFKTDVQKKFWELQWKTEKIHELVWKDLDVWFDLLWWNDDRQKITYKISSWSDYITIEKNEFIKEDESNLENTLEFVLEEDLEQNMSVSVIVNDVELYDEIKDLQKDSNKKMQVMEKMNKFIFLLDEEYKKIQKYQKEKEERNAVKWVFRNF